MTIHFLNGFTCNTNFPRRWKCGTLELLVETSDGLVLVDTGLGAGDYVHYSGILKLFRLIMVVPLDPEEAAIRQVVHLGYKPENVRHILLTDWNPLQAMPFQRRWTRRVCPRLQPDGKKGEEKDCQNKNTCANIGP